MATSKKPTRRNKRRTKKLLLACGIIIGLFLSTLLHYHIVKRMIRSPKRFQKEVGYSLPESIRMLSTEFHTSIFADGPNYEWLISAEASLLPWVKELGFRIGPGPAGWSHVKSFYEVTPCKENFKTLSLDSVWRVNIHSRKGTETSYIFVAGNHKIALIKTFRP